jgi:hypothetical protein
METQTDTVDPQQVLRDLAKTRQGDYDPVLINGTEWAYYASIDGQRPEISRDVAAGRAQIRSWQGNGFYLRMDVPGMVDATIYSGASYPDLQSAVQAAESFQWETVQHLDHVWYVDKDGDLTRWETYLGSGHVAKVTHSSGPYGGFNRMEQRFSSKAGGYFEVSCYRSGSDQHAPPPKSFEEAAAIALTLPVCAAAMMTKAVQCTWPAAPGQAAPAEA